MKRDTISHHIKAAVAQRAGFKCEYCLLPDMVSFYNFHIDHIKSIKHGGLSHIDNLAYCCPDCNYCKGTDIGSIIKDDKIIRFFNPRKDKWHEHFYLKDGMILCKTDMANVTERIFKFNDLDRLIFRRQLIQLNQYP
jgi:hypothetical protein